jgi:hypothetical protein
MDQKQRPLFLCDGIAGVGIMKSYWNYVPGTRKRQAVQQVAMHDASGGIVGVLPQLVEVEESGVLFDHSTAEVVDPRDFVWHESARDIDPRKPGGAQYLFHRCWYSFEQLKWLESMGYVSNVDGLKESRGFNGEYQDRETEVFNVDRTKDLIEVLEYWCFEGGKIHYAWIGNRTTVLKPLEESPFWHQQYPFSIASSMPQPFSLHGASTIELIEDLQEILWELQNQRLDNVELINNAIMLIRSDIDDPDAFEHYPGARWEVDDPQQVEPLTPPYQVAQVSIEAENLIKSDLQTVTSASPLAGGVSSGTAATTQTATGASIVMNAAQQQLAMRKYQAQFGLQREANLRFKNCQQFYGHGDPNDSILVHILGPKGALAFKDIPVVAIQGDFAVSLRDMAESDLRQERRAEANSVLQQMMQLFPSSYAAGYPIDVHEVVLWWARQWDIEEEVEAFFEPQQQPDPEMVNMLFGKGPSVQIRATTSPDEAAQIAGQAGYAPQGGGAAAPPGGGPNLGTTAATAVDASSPSATGGMSMSPQVFLQRALALGGGAKGR